MSDSPRTFTEVFNLDPTAGFTLTGQEKVGFDSVDSIPLGKAMTIDQLQDRVGGVQDIVPGGSITVDVTDPQNPVVAGGGVQSIVAGANITVDASDAENPIVSSSGGGGGGSGMWAGVTEVDTATVSVIPALSDANTIYRVTGLNQAFTVDIENDSVINFPVGTSIGIVNDTDEDSAAVINFSNSGGLIIFLTGGVGLDSAYEGLLWVTKVGTDTWVSSGSAAGGA